MSTRNYLSKLSDVKSPSEEVSASTDKTPERLKFTQQQQQQQDFVVFMQAGVYTSPALR